MRWRMFGSRSPILLLVIVAVLLFGSMARADYYLPDGRLVKFDSTVNSINADGTGTVTIVGTDGQVVTSNAAAKLNENGRLIVQDVAAGTKSLLERSLLSQDAGAAAAASEGKTVNTNTSVPVIDTATNKVLGYANLYTDQTWTQGKTYFSDGSVRDTYQGAAFNWTMNANNPNQQLSSVLVTTQTTGTACSGPGQPACASDPPPAGTTPPAATCGVPGTPPCGGSGSGGGGGGSTPSPPPPCEPDGDYRSLSVSASPAIVRSPGGLINVTAVISGSASSVTATASWGETTVMTQAGGAWTAAFLPPAGLRGTAAVTVTASLSQYAGCGVRYGPSNFTRTVSVTIYGATAADPPTPAAEQPMTAANLSLREYLAACLGIAEPWYCGINQQMAVAFVRELEPAQEAYRAQLGQGKWGLLVRRIDQALREGGNPPSGLFLP